MLVETIEKLKEIIPTVTGGDFSRYETYMKEGDEYLSDELLGRPLHQVIEIAAGTFTPPHGGAPAPASADDELVSLSTNVAGLKGYLIAIPFLDLVETETGFAVVSDQGNNVVPASKERVANLTKATEGRMSDAIEKLLTYLEDKTGDLKTLWSTSKYYNYNHDSYIFTLKEFRRYGKYAGSRLDFANELPQLTKAIRLKIEPIISQEQSAAIIAQLKAGSLDQYNSKIIEDLRFSLAAFVTGDENTANDCAIRARNTMIADVDHYTAFKASSIYTAIQAATTTDVNSLSIADFGI